MNDADGPDVRIRPAVPADVPALVDLREAVAGEGVWIGAEAPIDREGDAAKLAETIARHARGGGAGAGACCFVAEVRGAVVGSVVVTAGGGIGHLGMSVADGHRGLGLGAGLLGAAVAWARDAGCHKVELQHWPWNLRARALYERAGFVEEGYLRRHWRRRDGSLWDACVLGLLLDDEAPGHDVRAAVPPATR